MRIKEIRIEKGMSRKELANNVGLGATAITNYENGLREPKIDTLIKLSDVLGVTVDELIRETTQEEIPA